MPARPHTRPRLLAALALVGCVGLVAPVGGSPATAAKVPLSISIVGRHFVDGSGHTIRLLGVNHTSAEYACVDGFGYDDGHFDSADAKAIASWGANAVRVPLNEDCWLGLNGQPNSNEGADPALTVAGYRHEIKAYVADLNARGIYAILDLHWTAPGNQVALEQQPMPDLDHSPAFWSSVASTFKSDPAVVFDLFNEPYDPTDPKSGSDPNAADKVSWNCWETGTEDGPAGGTPCYTQAYDENNSPTSTYRVAGLQSLLDAIRAEGAKQPILAGGLDYANDLGAGGAQWMNHAPNDPLDREAASFHNYMGKSCDHAACWQGTIAPVAAHVPVVTGEFDEDDFAEAKCHQKSPSTFDADYMKWADKAGVSYLAWGWIVETRSEQDSDGCSAFFLIDDYTHYTPAKPNGTAVHAHLLALAAAARPPVTLSAFGAAVRPGNAKVGFTLRSPETGHVTISGRTASSGKAHPVAIGTVSGALKARSSRTLVLTLTRPARTRLVAKGSLAVRLTITLTSPQHRRTVLHRTVTLHAVTHHA